MNKELSPSALWDSMNDQQKIEWLAGNVMQWKKWYWDEPAHGKTWGWVASSRYASQKDKKKCDAYYSWNPLRDYEYLSGIPESIVKANWNHTMQLVEKMFKRKYEHGLAFRYENSGSPWAAFFFDPFLGSPAHHNGMLDAKAESKDGKEAICKAAFLALQ